MMVDMFKSLLLTFWSLLKIPLIAILVFVIVFAALIWVNVLIGKFHGRKLHRSHRRYIAKRSFLKKLFIDAPKQVAEDMYNKDPDFFRYQGIHLFAGEQGSGKTVAMTEFIMRMQREYPDSRCITNYAYKNQDDELKDWRQLIDYKNGIKGVIVGIDEIHMWFSSNESRDFPPDFLEVICQNRKNRRCIVASSQVFTRIAKPLREQTTLLYLPYTFLGCITIVLIKKPEIDTEGNVKKLKHRGFYWFVHDKELRDAFDTYKAIERLSKFGFKEQPQNVSVKNYIVSDKR